MHGRELPGRIRSAANAASCGDDDDAEKYAGDDRQRLREAAKIAVASKFKRPIRSGVTCSANEVFNVTLNI